MKIKLFGGNIEPACKYCENGTASKDMKTIICKNKGSVEPNFNCRAFEYSPLKRIPKKAAPLPTYNKKDFEL